MGAAKPPPPPSWAGTPEPSGGVASPIQVSLSLLRRYTASGTIDRNVVLIDCRSDGLHGVVNIDVNVNNLLAISI